MAVRPHDWDSSWADNWGEPLDVGLLESVVAERRLAGHDTERRSVLQQVDYREGLRDWVLGVVVQCTLPQMKYVAFLGGDDTCCLALQWLDAIESLQ